ncbi:MAG: DMT family transporter [Pseudomonadota bacterium]
MSSTANPPLESSLRGATYMLFAMFLAAGIDVSVKALTSDYSTAQIVLLRSLFALPLILIFCHYQGGLHSILTPRWGWQLYRGFLTAGANFGFFYGLIYVPLITAVLLAYISPVLIVLMSRFVLHEKVGTQRLLGCAIGVVGVLCVLRPDNIEWHPGMFAILGSAVCWALLSISNRQLAGLESPAALAFHTLPVSSLLAAVLTVGHWTQPVDVHWLLFITAGLCAGSAHFFVALAYKHARAATIAPLEYSNLIWAATAAYIFWREIPSVYSVIGGVAILAGGFLAVRAKV